MRFQIIDPVTGDVAEGSQPSNLDLGRFTIRAVPAGEGTRSVVFTLDGTEIVDDSRPFTLDASDAGASAIELEPGTTTITATAFSGPGGTGRALDRGGATVEVVGEPGADATGKIAPEDRSEFDVEGGAEAEAETLADAEVAAGAAGAATASGATAAAFGSNAVADTLASGSLTLALNGVDRRITASPVTSEGQSGSGTPPVGGDGPGAGGPPPAVDIVLVSAEAEAESEVEGQAEATARPGAVSAAAGLSAGVAAGFAAQVVALTDTATGELGTVFGDRVAGTAEADTLSGGRGIDLLRGLSGDDELSGGALGDLIQGGAGGDTLRGEAGDDQLQGSFGDDLLVGGSGADVLIGGDGTDTADVSDIAADDLLLFRDTSGVIFARDQASGEVDILLGVERIATASGEVAAEDVGTFDGLSFIASNGELIDRFSGLGLGPRDLIDAAAATFASTPPGTFGPPTFDGDAYLQANTDLLQELGLDPVAATLQYIEQGAASGRPRGEPKEPDLAGGPELGPEPPQDGNRAPVVAAPIDAPTGAADQPFEFPIPSNAFTDPDPDSTLTLEVGSLPTGLRFDDGQIVGVPVEVGIFDVRVTARDEGGLEATQTFELTISPTPVDPDPPGNRQPVVALPIEDQQASTRGSFTLSIPENTFADPDVDQDLVVFVSELPPGLEFRHGTISGTPEETGTFTIEVVASDPGGLTATDSFELVVTDDPVDPDTPPNSPPVVAMPLEDQGARVGEAFAFVIPDMAFIDPDPDTELSFTASALPPGLAFEDDRIVGTPSQPGSRDVTITATDEEGLAVTDTFTITVEPGGVGGPGDVLLPAGGTVTLLAPEGPASAVDLTFADVDSPRGDDAARFQLRFFLDGDPAGGLGRRLIVDEPGGTVEVAHPDGRLFDEVRLTDVTGGTTGAITEVEFGRDAAPFEPVEIEPGRSARVRHDGPGDAVAVELTLSDLEDPQDGQSAYRAVFYDDGARLGGRRELIRLDEPGGTVRIDFGGEAFDEVRLRDTEGEVSATISAASFFGPDDTPLA